MLNIHELESRWIKYKIKSYIPSMIISLLAIIVSIFLFVYFTTKNEFINPDPIVSSETEKQKEVVPVKSNLNTNPSKDPVIIANDKKTVAQTPKVSLEPSLNFINNIQNETPRYYNNNVVEKQKKIPTSVKQVPKQAPKQVPKQAPKQATPVKVKKQVSQQDSQSKTITIDKQVTQNDINHVLKRFKKSNNPALSLFVAKKYYELKDYKQAYNYALITNGINSNIEESWIVFAKSIYHLGEKEKAIEVLKQYIKKSGSGRAKTLLKNIHSGKVQ